MFYYVISVYIIKVVCLPGLKYMRFICEIIEKIQYR